MTDNASPFGFAIRRNGSCLRELGECYTDAGKDPVTSQHFFRCCPTGAECSNANTGVCCRDKENCKEDISNPPRCANATWNLYENYDGGNFCCEQGQYGFNRTQGGVGCGTEQDLMIESRTSLSIVSLGATPTPSSSLISSSSPASNSSSSSNTGAIAGGVVGGVAGLAIIVALLWYFMRRPQKQSPQADTPITEASMLQHKSLQSPGIPSELDGQGSVSELPSHKENTLNELPISSHKENALHELPESGKGR